MDLRPTRLSSPYPDSKYNKSSQTLSISSLNTNTSINESNRYFSSEYECLLECIIEYCQQIQEKAYGNIKQTCQMMKKYKIMKQFKQNIDIHWEKIKENMIQFLNIDKNIIQTYSQWKSSLLECQSKVQECKNYQQLRNTINFLQNSKKIKFNRPHYSIFNQQELLMNQKNKSWRQYRKQIENSGQVIKDYSIKIVELITEKDQNEKKFEQQSQKKAKTKNYFELRQKIIEEIKKKQQKDDEEKQNIINRQNRLSRESRKNSKIKWPKKNNKIHKCSCIKNFDESNLWIQKILKLYEQQR